MFVVLSPAKKLDFSPWPTTLPVTQPAMIDDATSLMRTARGLTQKKIRELMNLSPELAKLNWDRYRQFALPFTTENAKPAALAFDGDVYRGLGANDLDDDALTWAQDRLGILSGLFGLLRPLDLIQPYRLEMGTRLSTRRGANLYEFWGDRITQLLNDILSRHEDQRTISLASQEYIKSIRGKELRGALVSVVFHNTKDSGGQPMIGYLAKYARGLMARYVIENHIDRAEGLKEFNLERYKFQPAQSTEDSWVFSRRFIPAGGSG